MKTKFIITTTCALFIIRAISINGISIATIDKDDKLRRAKFIDIVTKKFIEFDKYGKIPSNIYKIPDRYKAKNNEIKVNILATADIHNCTWNCDWGLQKIYNKDLIVPKLSGGGLEKVATYVNEQRKRDKQLILVDGGDQEFSCQEQSIKLMNVMKYSAIVLGNHEFMGSKPGIDAYIKQFNKYKISVLGANIYNASNGKNYIKPYIIKKIKTKLGTVNVGILGLTIKEMAFFTGVDRHTLKQFVLKDLVKEAKKWIPKVKKDGANVVVAVVHSGENPRNPRTPGNRVTEIAEKVAGIDAIVAAHSHTNISEHIYHNPKGKSVIVTEPGKFGEYISHICFILRKNKNKWTINKKWCGTFKIGKEMSVDKYIVKNITRKFKIDFITNCYDS